MRLSRVLWVASLAFFLSCDALNFGGGKDDDDDDDDAEDEDGDGYDADEDCDDDDPDVNPGATEVCDDDDVDEDCDGDADDDDDDVDDREEFYQDEDGDGQSTDEDTERRCDPSGGWASEDDDCDDEEPDAYPGGDETWYDGVDGDCSGGSDYDQDGDGYEAESWGDDCDDDDPNVNPGEADFEDEDRNCDGAVQSGPVAVADYDGGRSSLETCSLLYLDGRDSRDPSGGVLTYDWALTDAPRYSSTTTANIVESDDAAPTFQPDVAGNYTFSLVVTDRYDDDSLPDDVTVTISDRSSNSAPVANAGVDQSNTELALCSESGYTYACDTCVDSVFTLDGGASSDADGEALTYSWRVLSGSASLSSTTAEIISATVAGSTPSEPYASTGTATVLELTVTDCLGETDTDTITLSEECTGTE